MGSTRELKRELGKKELFGIASGQIIGAGIFALVGTGIAMTGRSVSFAFILSAVWVVLLSIPWVFIGSTLRLRGGEYTQSALLLNEKIAGIFIVIYLIRNLQPTVYILAFTNYFTSLFPNTNSMVVSIILATLFFGINVFPTKIVSRVQNVLVLLLTLALTVFIIKGFPNIQPGYFKQPGFLTSGVTGLLKASAFLTFSTLGAMSVFQLSGEAKNPKVDIPFVLISSTLAVGVLYALVSSVAAGVLPVSEVAGENLTIVAKSILSNPLYLFFIIGGALGALTSSLNATIAWVTKPILQACEDGWFPRKLAYLHPKYKTPVYLIGLFYLITIIPIILHADITQVTSSVLILRYLTMIATALATMRLPKLFPEQWSKSPFKISQTLLNMFCIISTIVLLIQVYFNLKGLDIKVFIMNGALLLICIVYALWRYKSGYVKMTVSYEDD